MKTRKVALSEISLNEANPRRITNSKFQKLINSLLVLPKMLGIRPVVIDKDGTVLGGNMRMKALGVIAEMDEAEIKNRIVNAPDVQSKTQGEVDNLIQWWMVWHDHPTVEIIDASLLSKEEEKQFVIKDNVSYGDWDFDALANYYDAEDLNRWGVSADWNEDMMNEDYGNVTSGGEIDVADDDNVEIKFVFEAGQWNEISQYLMKIADTNEKALIRLMEGEYGI